MRICQIVSSFPPISWGGTETHNYTLVKYLIDKGYDTTVIVTGQDAIKDRQEYDGIDINYFKPKPLFWYRELGKLVNSFGDFDVIDVHRHHLVLPFLYWKTPLILSLHFFELTCPFPIKSNLTGKGWPRPCRESELHCLRCIGPRRYFRWKISRSISVGRTDSIMVKYESLKSLLMDSGIPEKKISVVPHWLDVKKIRESSKKKKKFPAPEGKNIVFLGRVDYEKGPDILLDAFPGVLEENPETNLLFIGGGPMLDDLKSKAKDLGEKMSRKIVFLGHVPNYEVPGYLGQADVLVYPHRFFNYEWGLLEGMCCHKPIVATDVFATREILRNRKNALLCGVNSKNICESICDVLSDRKLSKRLADAAFKTVLDKHSMRNLRIYEKMLGEVISSESLHG